MIAMQIRLRTFQVRSKKLFQSRQETLSKKAANLVTNSSTFFTEQIGSFMENTKALKSISSRYLAKTFCSVVRPSSIT